MFVCERVFECVWGEKGNENCEDEGALLSLIECLEERSRLQWCSVDQLTTFRNEQRYQSYTTIDYHSPLSGTGGDTFFIHHSADKKKKEKGSIDFFTLKRL